jgi:hypothetical protein
MSFDGPLRFEGSVECRIDPGSPLGLTLTGRSGGEIVHVTFVGFPPADFPARLDAPLVEPAGEHEYRIVAAGVQRVMRASRVFVHRDVREVFCGAVPGRRAPVGKRLFWRAVLAFAGSSLGRRMFGHARGGAG